MIISRASVSVSMAEADSRLLRSAFVIEELRSSISEHRSTAWFLMADSVDRVESQVMRISPRHCDRFPGRHFRLTCAPQGA